MEITVMTISDLDSIADNLLTDFDDFWNYNLFKSEFKNENAKYIVAKQNNEIVGFAGIWTIVDVAHIANIVVKKDMRNNGIGSSLLQELVEISTELNMRELTLEVNEHNTTAISLYKKFGFEQVGLRKKYYNNTDDAIIMTKSLYNN